MKSIIDLIFRNPAIKLVGILAILYFGLYQNKEDPKSLGNRLSKNNIEKNLKDAKKQGFFIVDKIRQAQETQPIKESKDEVKKINKIQK